MAEQGKADIEQRIKELEEEKRQLEQQVHLLTDRQTDIHVCSCRYLS